LFQKIFKLIRHRVYWLEPPLQSRNSTSTSYLTLTNFGLSCSLRVIHGLTLPTPWLTHTDTPHLPLEIPPLEQILRDPVLPYFFSIYCTLSREHEYFYDTLVYLLQDSSSFILNNLRSRKAVASFKDMWFTPKTEEASINLPGGLN